MQPESILIIGAAEGDVQTWKAVALRTLEELWVEDGHSLSNPMVDRRDWSNMGTLSSGQGASGLDAAFEVALQGFYGEAA